MNPRNDMQTQIATGILLAAAAYALYRIWKIFSDKKKNNGKCGGCTGCDINKNLFYNCD
jgi:hypothetical protein